MKNVKVLGLALFMSLFLNGSLFAQAPGGTPDQWKALFQAKWQRCMEGAYIKNCNVTDQKMCVEKCKYELEKNAWPYVQNCLLKLPPDANCATWKNANRKMLTDYGIDPINPTN